MTVATWKEEFYPKPADSVTTEAEAIDHSLQKWIGLRYENRVRHAVAYYVPDQRLVDSEREFLSTQITKSSMLIDADSCALCDMFHDEDAYHDGQQASPCMRCPLYKARGGVGCDDQTFQEEEDSAEAPWFQWTNFNDPEPMITWLEVTRTLSVLKNKTTSGA